VNYEFRVEFELGNAAQIFLHNRRFDLELLPMAGVLIVAASTPPKIRAVRLKAMGGGFNDPVGLGPGEAPFVLD